MASPDRNSIIGRNSPVRVVSEGVTLASVAITLHGVATHAQSPLAPLDGIVQQVVALYPDASRETAERVLVPLVHTIVNLGVPDTVLGIEALAVGVLITALPPTRRGIGHLVHATADSARKVVTAPFQGRRV